MRCIFFLLLCLKRDNVKIFSAPEKRLGLLITAVGHIYTFETNGGDGKARVKAISGR